jgi:hypothetical protein
MAVKQTGHERRLEPGVDKKSTRGNLRPSLPVKFEPRFLDDADSRIAVVRTIRKRVELLKEHCGADSYQKEMMCLHAAFLHVRLESMEVEALEGEPFNAGEFTQAVNCLTGLLKALGLDKHAKNVTDLKAITSKYK